MYTIRMKFKNKISANHFIVKFAAYYETNSYMVEYEDNIVTIKTVFTNVVRALFNYYDENADCKQFNIKKD